MSHKFSHSSRETYSSCGYKYKLKYVEKWRNRKMYSSLFFGNALDAAFSLLLLGKKRNPTEEELDQILTQTPEDVFIAAMRQGKNDLGETVDLPFYLDADYYFSDFDAALLGKEPLQLLKTEFPDLEGSFPAFRDECKAQIKDKRPLNNEDKRIYNYMNWLSLVEKGKLMIAAYKRDIMPTIEEVLEIQKQITLPNETGDLITGYIDFKCTFKDQPGVVYVCDNKTASSRYAANSVQQSEQLATYCEHEGVKTAAYIVVLKEVYKKEPRLRTQVVRDVVTEETFEKTFDEFTKMIYDVESGKFDKNESSCYSYGRPCPYYGLCKYNNPEGLVKK